MISIPHRYDKNLELASSKIDELTLFQFLIGTIKTLSGMKSIGFFKPLFQFLIGTIKTGYSREY
ncbi:hypothetical protein CTHBC1_2214 [Acetivibrio thermocellus BC1]|nr:hypothetical protein CTHBC1_2214 [Acetivibrio thermocellus BC1]